MPLPELRSRAQALAERIAANAPLSVLAAKRTAYLSRPDVFDAAEEIWAPVYLSDDAQEDPPRSATSGSPSGPAADARRHDGAARRPDG